MQTDRQVTLSGAVSDPSASGTAYAKAVITSGVVASASIGLISVSAGGSAYISDATTAMVTASPGAQVTIAAGSSIQFDITSATGYMTASQGLMQIKGGYGQYTALGPSATLGAFSGGIGQITGTSYTAWASLGGTMTMLGEAGSCTINAPGMPHNSGAGR